jgi:hypothetical protein
MSKPVNANYGHIAPVTPGDDTDLAIDGENPSGFVITTAVGTVAVQTGEGVTLTLPTALFTLKDIFPLGVKKILATGTTATGIYALYGVG